MNTEVFEYSTSLFFWIKGILEVTQRDIMICYPNTFLWFFPNGKSKDIIPLRNISGVSLEKYFDGFSFIVGLVMAVGGLFGMLKTEGLWLDGESFFSVFGYLLLTFVLFMLLLVVPGTLLLLSAFRKGLVIYFSGDSFSIEVPFFEYQKLYDMQDCVNDALDYEADKYDMNLRKSDLAEEIGDAVGRAMRRYDD